ncbi:hypothetical protein C3V43_01800 [Bacteroides heparinolyticus]|nr:hypothetical protein C3V43_01800 [Bacteroides heparinolyticus]
MVKKGCLFLEEWLFFPQTLRKSPEKVWDEMGNIVGETCMNHVLNFILHAAIHVLSTKIYIAAYKKIYRLR